MAAASQDVCQVRDEIPESSPSESKVLLANTTLWRGSLSMQVAGVTRPYASGVAGSTLLGFAVQRYVNSTGANKAFADDQPMVHQRGCFWLPGKAADLPTEAEINEAVYFDDSSGTVKKTMATNDSSGILRGIREGMYRVEI